MNEYDFITKIFKQLLKIAKFRQRFIVQILNTLRHDFLSLSKPCLFRLKACKVLTDTNFKKCILPLHVMKSDSNAPQHWAMTLTTHNRAWRPVCKGCDPLKS